MADFLYIDYKDGVREGFNNHGCFAKKYRKLEEKEILNTVKRFAFSECLFIHGMSDWKLQTVLRKGEEPSNGYIIYRKSGNEKFYKTADQMITKNKKRALIFTKEEAERKCSKELFPNQSIQHSYFYEEYNKEEEVNEV